MYIQTGLRRGIPLHRRRPMNRLWVRLSLMIAGVLFLVFFLQFASIMLSPDGGLPSPRSARTDGRPCRGAGNETTLRNQPGAL